MSVVYLASQQITGLVAVAKVHGRVSSCRSTCWLYTDCCCDVIPRLAVRFFLRKLVCVCTELRFMVPSWCLHGTVFAVYLDREGTLIVIHFFFTQEELLTETLFISPSSSFSPSMTASVWTYCWQIPVHVMRLSK